MFQAWLSVSCPGSYQNVLNMEITKALGEGKQIIPAFALESNTSLWLASGLMHLFRI